MSLCWCLILLVLLSFALIAELHFLEKINLNASDYMEEVKVQYSNMVDAVATLTVTTFVIPILIFFSFFS